MLQDILKDWKIVLASSSPRRKELLDQLGLDFKQLSIPFEETFPKGLSFEETAVFLAEKKADHASGSLSGDEILLTADTMVCYKDKILGKPADRDDAISILETLSGNKHLVITGVCIMTLARRSCFVSSTEVVFSVLEKEEIEYYVDSYKPYDKAGAYGIQEWIGHIGVTEIRGSYFNVMGLPVQRLYTELKNFAKELTDK